MRNLAPHIYRQRMVLEGIHTANVSEKFLNDFFVSLTELLKMTLIYGPLVKNLAGRVNPIHKGFEAIVIWAKSGAQLYTWEQCNFFTLDIYSCKKYEMQVVINFVKEKLLTSDLEYKEV